jgi:hypothetical protein
MITSVQCTFRGKFPETRSHRAEGRSFAKTLTAAFSPGATYDLWKDCGWIVFATLEVNVFFARYTPTSPWDLTITVCDRRSFVDRLLRRVPDSYGEAIQMAAYVVHRLLTEQPGISDVRWSLTGDPRKAGVASPEQLQWPQAGSLGLSGKRA